MLPAGIKLLESPLPLGRDVCAGIVDPIQKFYCYKALSGLSSNVDYIISKMKDVMKNLWITFFLIIFAFGIVMLIG